MRKEVAQHFGLLFRVIRQRPSTKASLTYSFNCDGFRQQSVFVPVLAAQGEENVLLADVIDTTTVNCAECKYQLSLSLSWKKSLAEPGKVDARFNGPFDT